MPQGKPPFQNSLTPLQSQKKALRGDAGRGEACSVEVPSRLERHDNKQGETAGAARMSGKAGYERHAPRPDRQNNNAARPGAVREPKGTPPQEPRPRLSHLAPTKASRAGRLPEPASPTHLTPRPLSQNPLAPSGPRSELLPSLQGVWPGVGEGT